MRVWRAGRSRRAQDAARFATPIAPPLWPPLADPVEEVTEPEPPDAIDAQGAHAAASDTEHVDRPSGLRSAPAAPVAAAQLEMQAEFLRLLEVVTSMCDHVIEYIEKDRAERRVMVETLTDLGRVITDGAAAIVAATASVPALDAPAHDVRVPAPAPDDEPYVHGRERVIGGSMPAGPEPVIDLVAPEPPWESATRTSAKDAAVEVRGRIGDRWVDGFEICEVMSTAAGPRYRLRRRLDGVVLPELFEASSIRHVDPGDSHRVEHSVAGTPAEREDERDDAGVSAPPQYWSRS